MPKKHENIFCIGIGQVNSYQLILYSDKESSRYMNKKVNGEIMKSEERNNRIKLKVLLAFSFIALLAIGSVMVFEGGSMAKEETAGIDISKSVGTGQDAWITVVTSTGETYHVKGNVKSNNEENGQTEIEMCGCVVRDKSADKSKESEKYAAATATSKTVSLTVCNNENTFGFYSSKIPEQGEQNKKEIILYGYMVGMTEY